MCTLGLLSLLGKAEGGAAAVEWRAPAPAGFRVQLPTPVPAPCPRALPRPRPRPRPRSCNPWQINSMGKSALSLASDRGNTRLQQMFVKAVPSPRE